MLDEDDTSTEELRFTEEELEETRDRAFAKGIRVGRRRQRDETLGMLEFAVTMNGSGKSVLDTLKKAWREEDHKRDHGKFSTTGGAQDGDVSTTHVSSAEASSATHGSGANPDTHAQTLASRIAEVPTHVAAKVKDWLSAKYAKLSARYGERGAKAILGAMVLLAPAPIPGSSLIPIALAEAVLAIRRAVKGVEKAMPNLDDAHIQALARDLLHELYEEMGEAPEPVEKAVHKFASTHVELPPDIGDRLKALADSIPDRDLGEDGREEEPHITVRYGLETDNPADVAPIAAGFGPVQFRLGKVSIFAGEESSKPYDVLKVDVDSLDLHELNTLLASLPHTDTHHAYKPHATIAYVKAGLGEKYAGKMGRVDATGTADEIVFSDRDRHQTRLSLGAVRKSKSPRHPPELELLDAAAEYVQACHLDGTDPDEGLHRLYDLEPDELEAIASGTVEKGFDPNEKRDEGGKWTEGGDKSSPDYTKQLGRLPKTEDEAVALATAARDAIIGEGEDDCATDGDCERASWILHAAHPEIEIWHGEYNGEYGHNIVKAGDYFIDITSDQFEGGDPIRVWHVDEHEKGVGGQYGEYVGFYRSKSGEKTAKQMVKSGASIVGELAKYQHGPAMLGTVEKAFNESLHPRSSDGRFIGKDAIQDAKSDPAKAKELRDRVKPEDAQKLEDALSGKTDLGRTKRGEAKDATRQKRERVIANRAKAIEIRNRLFAQYQAGEPLNPDDLRALIPHLSTMTHDDLSDVRTFLHGAGAQFGGERRLEERRKRLLDWARGQAEGVEEPVQLPPEIEAEKQHALKVARRNVTEHLSDTAVKFPATDMTPPAPAGDTAPPAKEGAPVNATAQQPGIPDTHELAIPSSKGFRSKKQAESSAADVGPDATVAKVGDKWHVVVPKQTYGGAIPTTASGGIASLSDDEFAKKVQAAADAHTHGWGDNKVYIADVYDALKKEDPSLSETDFKRRLVDAHGRNQLNLSRADMYEEMDPDTMNRSEADRGASGKWHFIQAARKDRAQRTRDTWRASGATGAQPSPVTEARAASDAWTAWQAKNQPHYDKYNAASKAQRKRMEAKLNALDAEAKPLKEAHDAAMANLAAHNGHQYGVYHVEKPGAEPKLIHTASTLADANQRAETHARDANRGATDKSGRDITDEFGQPAGTAEHKLANGGKVYVEKVPHGGAPGADPRAGATDALIERLNARHAGTKHSEVNAILRDIAKLTPEEAADALRRSGLEPVAGTDNRQELMRHAYDRQSSKVRSGLSHRPDSPRSLELAAMKDEPLLDYRAIPLADA